MQKTIKTLIIISTFLLIAGCGNNKEEQNKDEILSCSIEEEGTKIEIVSQFNDGIYKNSGTLNIVLDLKDYTDTEKELIKEKNICSIFKEAFKYDETKCKTTENNDSLELSVEFDIYEYIFNKRVEDDPTNDLKIMYNLDDTKNEFEKAGYTCEIK